MMRKLKDNYPDELLAVAFKRVQDRLHRQLCSAYKDLDLAHVSEVALKGAFTIRLSQSGSEWKKGTIKVELDFDSKEGE
jgi:hypothetical protein